MQTVVLEHPAVKAWTKLQPARVKPESIEILDRKKGTWFKLQSECSVRESIEILDRKRRAWIRFRSEGVQPEDFEILREDRFIYRLKGVGSEGSAVIAKECGQGTGMIEQTIYEQILSRLPAPTLHYYGFVEEPYGEVCWLLLEDAGTEEYSFHTREHRALAARWLGLMHTSAAHVAATARLPGRGPDYYLQHLRWARDTMQRATVNFTLSTDDVVALESLVSQCNALESCWRKVERFCDRMPHTLVHSDFNRRNLRIRNGQGEIALLVFDWEMAGWGIPAADLGYYEQADLAIYWSVVQQAWPHLDVQDIQRMANLGKIFRGLAVSSWESWPLDPKYYVAYEQVKSAVRIMKTCEGWITEAMKASKWIA